jgi:hypothetical protein
MRSLGLKHPRPRPFILDTWLNGNLELLGDFQREIDVSEEFPGEEDDVCFVCLEDFVGLSGFGDESDGADLAGGGVRDEDMGSG